MLNSIGGIQQFLFLQNNQNKDLIKLDKLSKDILVKTDLLTISEKLEIIELHLNLRLLTEVISPIKYSKFKRKDGFRYPLKISLNELQLYLNNNLPFQTSISKRKSKKLGEYTHVVYLFTNETLKEYFIKFEKNISALEVGILYGYHPKAVMAFCGYIKSCPPPKPTNAYQYYNLKVYPKDFIREVDYFHKLKWDKIKAYCPEIIDMAEEEFKTLYKS